ncbi:MAG TPA: DUF3187 family protein [Gemmatimonadales bacterium]|nr:DUF3187 family protein [Gemmatimonadales bacterium]
MTERRPGLLLLSVLLLAGALEAQSLPVLHSANPVAESRSGLYFQPLMTPTRGWQVALGLDYSSMIELNLRNVSSDTAYMVDAEVLRINLNVEKDLDARTFVLGEAWVGGSYGGFLDGFLEWYHGLFGIRYPERDNRGRNGYAYFYEFPDGGDTVRFARKGFGLGDMRLGIGRRFGGGFQSVVSVTLPTSTLGDGYGRKTASINLLNTVRTSVTPRLMYEGSLNLGYTPRQGELESIQNRAFVLATSGFRWRTTGRLWSFANLYLHSPYYHDALARQLEGTDLTIDFGWMIRGKSGREFRFGMTEDLMPGGPGIDATFRLGYSF